MCTVHYRRDEEEMQEGSSDDMAEQALKALLAPSSAATAGKVNYDDVDYRKHQTNGITYIFIGIQRTMHSRVDHILNQAGTWDLQHEFSTQPHNESVRPLTLHLLWSNFCVGLCT